MSAQYLCVGSLALNDTVYANGRTSMAAPGGNALYAAVGANIWSDKIGISAVVGYDWPAEYTAQLAGSAIDTRYLVEKDAETLRAWTVYEASGYRRYFSRNTEVVLLTPSPYSSTPLTAQEGAAYSEAARQVHLRNSPLPQELPPGWIDGIEAIHICPMRLETIIAWIDFLEAYPHIFVSVDILPFPLNGNLNHPRLLKILRRANAFMPSEAEAESLQPGHQAEPFCRQIAALGPQLVVIKQGDHGAVIFDRERNQFRHVPPFPADVDDLTGAGDSFCGGFLVGYAQSRDPWHAALTGTVSASHIIEGFGGLHALAITRATAEARLQELEVGQ